MVDRVVGPEELHEQDDELRDQLSRLQISSELCGNYMSCVSGFYLEILFWGGNMIDNFKDSKKGHNTPVGAFATSQL